MKSIALNFEAYPLKIENRNTNALNVETNALKIKNRKTNALNVKTNALKCTQNFLWKNKMKNKCTQSDSSIDIKLIT